MRIFFLFILLVLTNVLFASEIKTEMRILPEAAEYHEGDLVEIDLKIWPIENADLNEFQKLNGITIAEALSITELTSVGVSENNADVVIIKALAIVVRQPTESSYQLNYKNLLLALPIPMFKFIPLKNKSPDFYVLDQSLSKSYKWALIILILMVSILGIFFYFKKFESKKATGNEVKDYYNNLFNKAETRLDFEEIYAKRKEWVPLLMAETIAHREFFNIMELHQYKKIWGVDENADVKNSFETIRRSFS